MFAALESQPIKPTLLSTSSQNLPEGGLLPLQEPHWLVIQTPEDSEKESTDYQTPNSDVDPNNNTEDDDDIPLIRLLQRMKGGSSIAGGIMVNALNGADSERAQELMGNPWGVELERVSKTQAGFDRESCQEREVIVERGRPRLELGEREWPREVRSRYRGRRGSREGRNSGGDESTSLCQVKTMRTSMPREAGNISTGVGSSGSSSVTSCQVVGIQHSPRMPRPVRDDDCFMGNTPFKHQTLPGQNCRRQRPMMSLRHSDLSPQPARFPANACMTWVSYLPNYGPEVGLATLSVRDGPWKQIRAHMESIPAIPKPKLLDIREAIIVDRQRRMPWLYKGGNRPATEFPRDWGLKTYSR